MRISDWSSDVCSSDLSFNYETRDVYEIKIRSHDTYEYIEQTFFIDVTDVNDIPSNPNVESITIPEDYPIHTAIGGGRSEASRVGKECVSTCRARWSPYHKNKKKAKDKTTQNNK